MKVRPVALIVALAGGAAGAALVRWVYQRAAGCLSQAAVTPPIVVIAPGEDPAPIQLRNDALAFLNSCRHKYGDVFTVEMENGQLTTYVMDPHLFPRLLDSPKLDFAETSRQGKKRLKFKKLISTDDNIRLMSRHFRLGLSGDNLADLMKRFQPLLISRMLSVLGTSSEWKEGRLADFISETLMFATTNAFFGEGTFSAQLRADVECLNASISTRFPGSDGVLAAKGEAAEERVRSVLKGVLRNPNKHQLSKSISYFQVQLLDLLDIQEDERVSFLLEVFWASLVNMIPTHFWLLSRIAGTIESTSEAAHVVQEEVGKVWPGLQDVAKDPQRRTAKPILPLQDLDQLTKTSSIIDETLRLHSKPNMYRYTVDDFEIQTSSGRRFLLPSKTWIALFPRTMHWDDEIYADPFAFEPSRFMEDEVEADDDSESIVRKTCPMFSKYGSTLQCPLMVFGRGRGYCPGKEYASAVMKTFISIFFGLYEMETLEPIPGESFTVSSVPPPAEDIQFRFRYRG